MIVSLNTVGSAIARVAGVAYKAAFLFLAYEFVVASIEFYQFQESALVEFYKLFSHG